MPKISKNIFLNEPPQKKNCEGKLRNILEYCEIIFFNFFFKKESSNFVNYLAQGYM